MMTATDQTTMPDHDPSRGLLLVTDGQGIDSLLETGGWQPIALRPDQRVCDQILFLDGDSGQVSYLAILDVDSWKPWKPDGCSATLWSPVVATVTELLDPIEIGGSVLRFLAQQFARPLRQNVEAATVDLDLVNASDIRDRESREDLLLSEVVDQLVLNRRCPDVLEVFRWLDGVQGLSAPFVEPRPRTGLTRLPDRWRAVVPRVRESEVLATLNSYWKG